MSQRSGTRDNTLSLLAFCGMAGPILFVVLVVVGSSIYPGYSHLTQAISELGGIDAPNPLVQNANFFTVGVLIAAFASGLHKGIGEGKGSKLGPALIGVFGVLGTMSQAFLPCDRGCEFESLTGSLHNLSGLSGFLAAVAGMLVISRRLAADQSWQPYAVLSAVAGVAALVGLLAWVAISKAAGVESVNGLLQRVFVGIILLWIEVMATRLFWMSRKRPESYVIDTPP